MICRSIFLTVLISLDLLCTGLEISQVAIFFVPCVKKLAKFHAFTSFLGPRCGFSTQIWRFMALSSQLLFRNQKILPLLFHYFLVKLHFFIFLLVQILSYTHAIFFTIFTRKKKQLKESYTPPFPNSKQNSANALNSILRLTLTIDLKGIFPFCKKIAEIEEDSSEHVHRLEFSWEIYKDC